METLYAAINDLKQEEFEAVRNRGKLTFSPVLYWRGDLKPPVQNPRPTIPRKRSQLHQLLRGNATADGLYQSTDSSRAIEPAIFKLKDPRPDICVGLSDDSLTDALRSTKDSYIAQSLLLDMQDTSTLISDPHVTPLGLRFPFLIVEAKAGATGWNLYQAQNQAAVGGSTALLILKGLSGLRDGQDLNEENYDDVEASNEPGQASPNIELNIVFSITTEGPVHESWIHFREPKEEDFCMVCIGTWRTTLKDGSPNFLRHLSAILRWGNGEFKDQIISVLKDL
ncbi:hypothetical protein AFLA70_907g000080 [Aspergillus flavus AF70]|nr:hypothetical protein AFLA70_907g000080 [Aspergillus flavus AF70]